MSPVTSQDDIAAKDRVRIKTSANRKRQLDCWQNDCRV